MRTVLTALIVLTLLSCSSTGPRGPHTEAADEAYRTGDFERAYELYSARYQQRQDPLVKEKMTLAWARARGSQAVDADQAARDIRETKTMIERGDRMLAAARYEDALKAYRTAQQYVPGIPAARQGEVKAERALASEAISAARAFEAKGELGAAITVLGNARAAIEEPLDPETDPLTVADRELRARVERRLLDGMTAEIVAGRPSVAGLYADAWFELTGADAEDGLPPAVGETLVAVKEANDCWIQVADIADATEGRIDPASFTTLVLEAWHRLEFSSNGADGIFLKPDAEDTHLTLAVTVETLTVETSEPETTRKKKEFVVHTDVVENPRLAKLRKTRDRLQEDVRLARDVAYATRQEFDSVRSLEGDAEIHARYSRLYGHYSTAGYYRHLANARTRNAKAMRRVDKIQDNLDEVLAAIGKTAPVVYRETRTRATVQETTQTKSARAIASFRIAPAGTEVAFDPVSSEATATEEVTDLGWTGDADAGVPEEPLALPSDAAMAETVLAGLAEKLANGILEAARTIHRQTWREARALEKEGRHADALDRYAGFLLTARTAFPLEARVAADKIEAEWGLKLTDDGTLDISELRLK